MMVCTYDGSQLLLVLQTEHSRVAGFLAAHWGNDVFVPLRPYASMVLAAQEHDNGWWDWEIKPTLSAEGHPLDYIGSTKSLGALWLDLHRGGIDRVARQDPYAGLMVSMHAEGLVTRGMGLLPYRTDYSEDAGAQEFVREQKALREGLMAGVRQRDDLHEVSTDDHIWTNYKMMEVFDQFGQFLCNRYPFNSTERQNGPSVCVGISPGRSVRGNRRWGKQLLVCDGADRSGRVA